MADGVTVQDAAARLGVTRQTVHTLMRIAKVPKLYASIGGKARRVIPESWIDRLAAERGGGSRRKAKSKSKPK